MRQTLARDVGACEHLRQNLRALTSRGHRRYAGLVDDLALVIGRGGWLRIVAPDLPAPVYARAVADEPTGPWRVGELHIAGALTVEEMRSIPLARLEAVFNEPNMAATLTRLMSEMSGGEAKNADVPRDALGVLVPEPPADEEPGRLFTFGPSREAGPGSAAAYFSNDAMVVTIPTPTFKLTSPVKVPKTRKRPDEFYREVASLFSLASATGSRPAARIAKANRVPTSTVHRWVAEARRRGVMGPARHATTKEGTEG